MNKFIFENQGTNTFLVYEISDNDVLDSMSIGMLSNNKIPGLANTMFMQMDNTKFVKYNVSSKVSVSQFFSGIINKKRLIGVLRGISNAIISAEEYMIDDRCIVLDLDYIFVDVSTCDTSLICLPFVQDKERVNIAEFFKNIIFTNKFDQTENCDYVAKIINYINSNPSFSLNDFRTMLDELSIKPVNQQENTQQHSEQINYTVNHISQQPKLDDKVLRNNISNGDFIKQPQIKTENNVDSSSISNVESTNGNNIQSSTGWNNGKSVENVNNNKPEEKKITMINLLMHYNKENARLYKEQKERRKQEKLNNKNISTEFNGTTKNINKNNVSFEIPNGSNNQSNKLNQNKSVINGPQQNINNNTANTTISNNTINKTINEPNVSTVNQFEPNISYNQSQPMSFGETTVLGCGMIGETTVLTSNRVQTQIANPHLIRAKNNEKIMLNKPLFRIGKEKSYVDYFIGDNTAISRSHAQITTNQNNYFIMDTNSTNHTFLNGVMLKSNVETQIQHLDRIRLANEEFEFKLY